jgi:hypothetical protein
MKKLFLYAAIVVMTSASATLAIPPHTATNGTSEPVLATDGAFRDGIYLGRLSAVSGQPRRAPIGRWSTEQDRARFAAGYRLGYEHGEVR